MPQGEDDEMSKECEDCGLHKTKMGYIEYFPSDAHDMGGHNYIEYDIHGRFLFCSSPWQASIATPDLTQEEMDEAL